MSDECWICMGRAPPFLRPCLCPKSVHGRCLARWQLQKAGQSEETQCRFCQATLPDWREHLGGERPDASPTMSVEYRGEVKLIKMRAGQSPDLGAIERLIKRLFEIPDSQELNLKFECRVPDSDEALELEGNGAFPAALHCATMTAHRNQLVADPEPAEGVVDV